MITSYLILAHLFADFILQPNKLIRFKTKSPWGVALHVGIFFVAAVIFLFPYITYWQVWAVIAGISIIHYAADQIKVYTESKKETFPLPFIADQIIHLLSLVIGGNILARQTFKVPANWFYENIYLSWSVWFSLALIVFVVYAFDIIFLQKAYLTSYTLRKEDKKNRKHIIRKKLIIFITIYIIFILSAVLIDYFLI